MKNRIMKNVNLDRGEVVQKEFRSLQAKHKFCSILVTDKRLIIYTFGRESAKGRYVKRQVMNEIDLRSIHRFEYYYEFHRRPVIVRTFGLIFFVLGLVIAYLNYRGLIPFNLVQSTTSFALTFGLAAILVVVGLFTVFASDKVLVLQMKSGLDEKTSLIFYPTKENELALRYIAGSIHLR